jgi:hypothetical protein
MGDQTILYVSSTRTRKKKVCHQKGKPLIFIVHLLPRKQFPTPPVRDCPSIIMSRSHGQLRVARPPAEAQNRGHSLRRVLFRKVRPARGRGAFHGGLLIDISFFSGERLLTQAPNSYYPGPNQSVDYTFWFLFPLTESARRWPPLIWMKRMFHFVSGPIAVWAPASFKPPPFRCQLHWSWPRRDFLQRPLNLETNDRYSQLSDNLFSFLRHASRQSAWRGGAPVWYFKEPQTHLSASWWFSETTNRRNC